ncbi:MAG: sulfatase-like hydrolase/transferase [Saprospirales bacterium]|nr:sulfatase-like hydrolase/transferase [Saprospirales bacterium]
MNTTIVLQVNNLARNARMGWAFFLRLLLFWLLFFAVFRLFFILWLRSEWAAEHPWPALWKALPLDLSMAGYLLAVPVLFWFAGLALGNKGRPGGVRLINGFTILVFAFLVFVFGSNVFIYQEWHTPLNSRALEYFKTPAAMLDSMSAPFKLFSLAAYSGLMWLWWRVYRRMVGDSIYPEEISRWQSAWLPVQMGILFLFIRGGIGVMPVNESAVYYSPHLFNNHAATNTAWHLIHSMIETRQTQNPYRFMPDALARERTKQFLKNKTRDTPPHNWLKTSSLRPNLVFILMESMTAQVVEELGGEKGVCPNLSRLAQEGILFERCYSSGYRTDQGLVSILGGYPAQPETNRSYCCRIKRQSSHPC